MSSVAILEYKGASALRSRRRSSNRLFALLIGALFIVLALEMVFHFVIAPNLLIDKVQITASDDLPLSNDQIVQIAGLDRPSYYFSLDVARIKAKLEAYPIIKEATVRKVFPAGIAISLVERRPFAVTLVNTASGSIPVAFDADGVVVRIGAVASAGDLPFVSGVEIPELRLGMRLPGELARFLSDLERIKATDPSLFADLSEVRFVRTVGSDFDVMLYPLAYRVPVLIGDTVDDQELRYIMMTLDVVAQEGLSAKLSELDFRSGQVVYRLKGGS